MKIAKTSYKDVEKKSIEAVLLDIQLALDVLKKAVSESPDGKAVRSFQIDGDKGFVRLTQDDVNLTPEEIFSEFLTTEVLSPETNSLH